MEGGAETGTLGHGEGFLFTPWEGSLGDSPAERQMTRCASLEGGSAAGGGPLAEAGDSSSVCTGVTGNAGQAAEGVCMRATVTGTAYTTVTLHEVGQAGNGSTVGRL